MTDKNSDNNEKTKEADSKNKESTCPSLEDSSEDKEIGGPKGLEPTRYGDWERNGRCVDF